MAVTCVECVEREGGGEREGGRGKEGGVRVRRLMGRETNHFGKSSVATPFHGLSYDREQL